MLNELAKEIHQNAIKHGWWDEQRTFGEIVALCHSELSEALEEYRDGRPMVWYACKEGDQDNPCGDYCSLYNLGAECEYQSNKPEGIAMELADCLIRILDWAGKEGLDMDAIVREKMDYNRTRPYRHGGKKL